MSCKKVVFPPPVFLSPELLFLPRIRHITRLKKIWASTVPVNGPARTGLKRTEGRVVHRLGAIHPTKPLCNKWRHLPCPTRTLLAENTQRRWLRGLSAGTCCLTKLCISSLELNSFACSLISLRQFRTFKKNSSYLLPILVRSCDKTEISQKRVILPAINH